MLPVCLLVTEVRASGEPTAAATPMAWPVKYERGVITYSSQPSRVISQRKKLQITLGEEAISCVDEKGVALEIPVAGVLAITYDNTSQDRGMQWLRWAGPNLVEGCFDLGCGVVFPVLAVGGVLAPFNTKKHYVTVLWKDGRISNSVVFKVGKGEYRQFLEALQEATGREWEDFPQVRKKLQADLKREKRHAVEVWLDRHVRVSGTVLEPGRYQIVALEEEEEENRGTVYFFRGRQVNTTKIDGLLPVEIVAEPSAVDEPAVIFEEDGRNQRIRAIHLPDKSFRQDLHEDEPRSVLSTEELQELVVQYADEPGAFDPLDEFHRLPDEAEKDKQDPSSKEEP